MHWINRLEAKFGHWAVPSLTSYIAFFSGLCYVLLKVSPAFIGFLVLSPAAVMHGEVWRLFTYFFIPQMGSLIPMPDWVNAAFYILFLIWMGHGLDTAWGAFKTNLYCLTGMIAITVATFFFDGYMAQILWSTSLLFAYAHFYGEQTILAFYVIPVKIRWLAWATAVWLAFQALTGGPVMLASVIAVVANYYLFFAQEIIAKARFRSEVSARRARFEEQAKSTAEEALHRCQVCGRTEQSSPELEFRVAADGEEYCREHLPR